MTERHLRALSFIRDHIEKHGIAPSFPEIAAAIGTKSRGSAHTLVEALVRDGQLERTTAGARNLKLPGVSLAAVPTAALQAELERRGGN